MNSQGYTKDNIHKGNTKIVAGGIDVDGLVRIGDQSVGGDGYVLPPVKGSEGQVLTMNSDNTTSFQDSGGLSGRVVKNLFTMIDNNTTFTANPADTRTLYSTGYGSMDIPNIDDFPVGATIHIYAKGVVDANLFLNNSEIRLEIDGGTTNIVFNGLVSCDSPSLGNNFFYLDLVVQRTQTNEYKFKGNGLNPTTPRGSQIIMAFLDTTISPITPLTQFNMRVTNLYTANQFTPITRVFIVNMILDSSLLLTAPPAPTSHLALTDLTADDAGHTQFPLLNGRNGGQVLSGGLTPLHFLTLKSHNTGLNNIVVKDLNTTFEKNIDMDSNDINNANVISSSGVLNIKQNTPANDIKLSVDTEELVIKQSVYGGVKLIEADPLKQIQIGTDDGIGNDSNMRTLSTSTQFDKNIEMNANINDNSGGSNVIGNGVLFWGDVRSTKLTGDGIYEKSTGSQNLVLNAGDTQSLKNVDMNANDINNVKDINGRGGLNLLQVQNTNGLFYIDGGEIRMTADTSINLYPTANLRLGNAGQDISINPTTKTDHIGDLDMFDNEILQCNNIRTNTQPIFTINKNGSNATEIYGNSTIRRIQVSNAVYLLTGTNLECGTNDINDCGNLNVVSINNLTPVGGLSSGTSNSALLTASTAEQSILALTFVGGRQAPANTFKVGDSYTATLAGNFSSNNGDTLTLRLKGGTTGTTILSSLVVPLNGSSGVYYELEINFVVRAIGGAGVADLAINYDFSYNQSAGGNFQGERKCEVNNTTFDTTILNQLDITAQFSSTNAGNSIETLLSTLGKNY